MFRWPALVLCAFLPVVRSAAQCVVAGRLQGREGPVPFAHVLVDGTTAGAVTDVDGRFKVDVPCDRSVTLSFRAVGFEPRSLKVPVIVQGGHDLGRVAMESLAQDLGEVVITGTMKEVSRDDSPVLVEVITPKLFRKNPESSLLGSIGMVNGVRPQLNCSVCNTGDIHINGMEGPYTMVLIDGMPIVSGLSTVYGLSGIPISLIERVEVVKGPGSSLYGSEAMGGIINVITKDPVLAPRAAVDLMATSWGELNGDIGLRLGRKKVNDLLGVNVFNYTDPRDGNGDGFTDITIQKRVSIFNKLALRRPDRRVASLAARYVDEDRWGGQMNWEPRFAGGDSLYGETIRTRRWELIGQYQLPLPGKLIAQVSANGHQQRSWYGTTPYNAAQQVLFGQLYWSKAIGVRHDLLVGIAYRQTNYDDDTPATYDVVEGRNRPERRPLPGVFVQDEWSLSEVHRLLLGYRVDHDRDHGVVRSPRLAYKWTPNGRWSVRANFGTGYRVVNLFTEDHAALTGARTVVITEDLEPERSLNGTLNVVRKWPGEKRFVGLDASIFYSHFSNRILPDYTTDQRLIVYDNLSGSAISRGISVNGEMRVGDSWRGLLGLTGMEVFVQENGTRQDQYFAPRWSGTFTLSHDPAVRWSVDLTGQVYGPMRLPTQQQDPRPTHSPTHALVNIQLKHVLDDRWEIYGGVKNLLDFVPRDPILRPFDPFNRQADDPESNPNGLIFDPAYIYAPLQGARGFLGVRWELS